MPTPQQLRDRLLKKLKELFQLDQPDLDFGFYKIMHAKSVQVQEFIEEDLLKIVEDAFGEADEVRTESLRQQYEQEIETAKEYGAEHPENSPKVREAKGRWEEAKNTGTNESDIYDHLYRFFERYYDSGDFLSRRYYARETPGKAAPYAIPYSGEEVKLHWANADQYYIKTAEYFSNFTFDLTQTVEIREMSDEQRILHGIPKHPVKVHFRIAEASEGEHGNVKAAEANKRYFIIHKDGPVEITDEGELVVYFEYRTDPEKTGQEKTWREKRNAEAVGTILKALKDPQITQITQKGYGGEPEEAAGEQAASIEDYIRLLEIPAPTEKDKHRPLLAKYINKYTARNTMDYFIHKDLGAFLRRELDFYVKNEVMRLDDIENADVPAVETWLAKVRVLRKIAGKLIDFLAQLEDFQKKLWLKKKFVVEANYCITLDRVPEGLYPEIAANQAQHDEWVQLFAIDEIQSDTLGNPGYAKPLTVEFLKANDKLLLDTRFFDEEFKGRLLASIEDFDEECDGLLIHSENFQALSLLQGRYQKQVKCTHIDPPYNTATSGFLYKNEYQHSSWMALMENRLFISLAMLNDEASYMCHIDENEYENLFLLFEGSGLPNAGTVVWDKRNPMNAGRGVATQHEYIILKSRQNGPIYLRNKSILSMLAKAKEFINKYGEVNDEAKKQFLSWVNSNKKLTGGEKAYRHLDDEGRIYRGVSLRAPEPRQDPKFHQPLIHPVVGKPCAMPPNGFSRTPETLQGMVERGEILFGPDETTQPQQKVILTEDKHRQISSLIQDAKKGKAYTDELGISFAYCHPVSLYKYIIGSVTHETISLVLDYFAGSGTTGHAVINLNREDNGNRKYILVEMADYFNTVLKPRITKVVYSSKWKYGKPTERHTGISHCFKYIRLESYEDTLNNLRFEENPLREKVVNRNQSLKEDYMLNYLLDVETRGSQSLLNIDAFADPCAYTLKVKKPGSDEYTVRNVDLMETFNYLIGLRVIHTAEPQKFTAKFKRVLDPEAPRGQETKLVLAGKLLQIKNQQSKITNPHWWFRKIEGWVPADPSNPDNGKRENVLIVWRNLNGDLEQDNAVLDEWFRKNRISTRDFEFDTIYVNGSNNLPNLRLDSENWKVRLMEEEFMKRMWDVEGV